MDILYIKRVMYGFIVVFIETSTREGHLYIYLGRSVITISKENGVIFFKKETTHVAKV